jgi:hypothetical protein
VCLIVVVVCLLRLPFLIHNGSESCEHRTMTECSHWTLNVEPAPCVRVILVCNTYPNYL